jgi:DNA-binding transcriptional ArsR family regulator
VTDPWEQPDYVDREIARAIAHPVRAHILAEVNQRVMSPSQFAARHDLDLSNVSYHFRQLEKYECVEIVAEIPVRGSTEHFYKATKRALFEGKAWEDLPETVRNKVSGRTISDFLSVISEAMLTETFDAREDRHLTWQKGQIDERGWEEAVELYQEMARRLLKIVSGSQSRLIRSGEKGLMATWGQMLFESPFEEPEPGEG